MKTGVSDSEMSNLVVQNYSPCYNFKTQRTAHTGHTRSEYLWFLLLFLSRCKVGCRRTAVRIIIIIISIQNNSIRWRRRQRRWITRLQNEWIKIKEIQRRIAHDSRECDEFLFYLREYSAIDLFHLLNKFAYDLRRCAHTRLVFACMPQGLEGLKCDV